VIHSHRLYQSYVFKQLLNNLSTTIILVTLAFPASADLSDQWYAGVGGSGSLLLPRAEDNSITREDEQGTGGIVFLGRDFDYRSSGQVQLYSLGEMTFSDNSIATYLAADASLLYRFYDTRDNRRNAVFGASLYGRFALGYINRDAEIPFRENSGSSVYFGVGGGVETYLSNTFSIRGEVIYLDRDAITASISLVTRFGGGRNRLPQLIPSPIPRAEPVAPTVSAPTASEIVREEPVRSNGVLRPQARPIDNGVRDNASSRRPFPDDSQVTRGPDNQYRDATNIENTLPEVTILGSSLELARPGEAQKPSTQVPVPVLTETDTQIPAAAPTGSEQFRDSDGDGILDSIDQCGNSNSYYPVNRSGCSLINTLDDQIKFQQNSPLHCSYRQCR